MICFLGHQVVDPTGPTHRAHRWRPTPGPSPTRAPDLECHGGVGKQERPTFRFYVVRGLYLLDVGWSLLETREAKLICSGRSPRISYWVRVLIIPKGFQTLDRGTRSWDQPIHTLLLRGGSTLAALTPSYPADNIPAESGDFGDFSVSFSVTVARPWCLSFLLIR